MTRVVVEYDRRSDHWYVWSYPTLTDRLFFQRTGEYILGSGHTREQALEAARNNLRKERPTTSHEAVEL